MQKFKYLVVISMLGLLYGCASTYPCGEPSDGVCSSVSDNYKSSFTNYTNPDDIAKDSPSSRVSSSSNTPPMNMNFTQYSQVPANGAPLLSMPKMVRVWLTPYTDSDNIYHDQSYEYVIVDKGRWNFSNNKLMLDDDSLKNVTPDQVTTSKNPGYGGFGMATQPPKAAAPASPSLSGFPAINTLQSQQVPMVTTSIGGGLDRTTTILP